VLRWLLYQGTTACGGIVARVLATDFDVIVIGGGVKGSAIARDAVGRGLRVMLCEQGDLGGSCVRA